MLKAVTIIGRISGNVRPEEHVGRAMVSFRVAVDRDRKGLEGEQQTDFFTVAAWGRQAEFVVSLPHEGQARRSRWEAAKPQVPQPERAGARGDGDRGERGHGAGAAGAHQGSGALGRGGGGWGAGAALMQLEVVPVERSEASDFAARLHRRHQPVVGHKFRIGVAAGGVAIIGRPVARPRAYGTRNACSALHAAAWRAARAMGYRRRLGTYTPATESGAGPRAAGRHVVHRTSGGSRSRAERPRMDKGVEPPKWPGESA